MNEQQANQHHEQQEEYYYQNHEEQNRNYKEEIRNESENEEGDGYLNDTLSGFVIFTLENINSLNYNSNYI